MEVVSQGVRWRLVAPRSVPVSRSLSGRCDKTRRYGRNGCGCQKPPQLPHGSRVPGTNPGKPMIVIHRRRWVCHG